MHKSIDTVDLELKRAFTELHVTKLENAKKLKALEVQTQVLWASKMKYAITHNSIDASGRTKKVYASVGRMFLLSTTDEMYKDLKSKEQKCSEVIKQLEEKKKYLKKCSAEQEANLRELVQQKKNSPSGESKE